MPDSTFYSEDFLRAQDGKLNEPSINSSDLTTNTELNLASGDTHAYSRGGDILSDLHNASATKGTSAGGFSGMGGMGTRRVVVDTRSGSTDVLSDSVTISPFPIGTPYEFRGSMSEEVMHRYLDRAIQMNSLPHMWAPDFMDGPQYGPGYDPWTNKAPLYDPAYPHGRLLKMILNTGAKFVFDTAILFNSDNQAMDYLSWIIQTLKNDNDFLHAADPEIICGASFAEVVPNKPIKVLLPPPGVISMFWYSRPSSADPLYFDYKLMQIDYTHPLGRDPTNSYDHNYHLDLSKPEAMMWYYWLAVKCIDAGCEAIHFGDLFDGCVGYPVTDAGNIHLWNLTQTIRLYARFHARRGVVLLDTHASNDPADKNRAHYLYGWYYDPGTPLPDWQRQLIFDFHSLGTYYVRDSSQKCSDSTSRASWGTSVLPVTLSYGSGLLNHSKGGLNPQGWLCSHNPVLCRFDNGGIDEDAGCLAHPRRTMWAPDTYGYDNTSWFARQKPDQRQAIIAYTYYLIKCVDPYSHFCMPGSLLIRQEKGDDNSRYFAFSEELMIKTLWNAISPGRALRSPDGFMQHNFTLENIENAAQNAGLGLILVGKDKMFYIGNDGFIHGYIYNNGSYNGGNWLTVSPSYAAEIYHGQRVSSQKQAKSDLVASPDGKMLLYIGVDNYIHGFNINSPWDYDYFDFMLKDMRWQSIQAASCLIFPKADRVYYIALQTYDGKKHVHGFIKGTRGWSTVSPSYSAEFTFHQSVGTQAEAKDALTYDNNTNRIYYTGGYGRATGHLFYYSVHNLVDYSYVDPKDANSILDLSSLNLQILGSLAIAGNRIYFTGLKPDGSTWIYCLIDGGSRWDIQSPSYSAVSHGAPLTNQVESYFLGQVAVSPDGRTIAYVGANQLIFYFKMIDSWNYSFHSCRRTISGRGPGSGVQSLQFSDNSCFFYISRYDSSVYRYLFEEDYCSNRLIAAYLNILPISK